MMHWYHEFIKFSSWYHSFPLLKSVNIANVWLSYWYLQCVIILLISPILNIELISPLCKLSVDFAIVLFVKCLEGFVCPSHRKVKNMTYTKVLDFEFWFFLLLHLFLRLEYYKHLALYDHPALLNICTAKSSKNKKNYIKTSYNLLWDKVYISNRLNGFYLVITCITLRNTKIIINSFFTNKKNLKIYVYIIILWTLSWDVGSLFLFNLLI